MSLKPFLFRFLIVKEITKPIVSDIELKRKETRVILGGKENWKNAATTSGGKKREKYSFTFFFQIYLFIFFPFS